MSNPEMWIAVYSHECGVDVFPFWFYPEGDLKYPSPAALVEAFSLDFEPEKGETLTVMPAHTPMKSFRATETFDGEQVGSAQLPTDDWQELREEWPLGHIASLYEDGECPDCGEDIPADAMIGEKCLNCGHVWTHSTVDQLDSAEKEDLDRQIEKFTPPDQPR